MYKRQGRGEKEKAHGYAQTAMQLALLMGLAYGIIVALFANQLVGFFKLDDAEDVYKRQGKDCKT